MKISHERHEMRVAVLMFYDDAAKKHGDLNSKINRMYCEKHNIDLIVSQQKLYTDRHPSWEKLPLVLKHIHDYSHIIWMDADAFFYVDAKNILDLIQETDTDFIFSKDRGTQHRTNINAGMFIAKNTPYTISFLQLWAHDETLYTQNPYPYFLEQGVLMDMHDRNILDIKNHHVAFEYGFLQHFGEAVAFKSYVLHMAGTPNKETIFNVSRDYLERIHLELLP